MYHYVLSKKEQEVLNCFYDKQTGWYYIPFELVSETVTVMILKLIQNGYALSAWEIDGLKCYTVFNLAANCSGYGEMKVMRDKLYDFLHVEFGCHYFVKMSFDEYFSNKRYQQAIDYVLINGAKVENQVEEHSIVMIYDEDYFKFVEAKNLFFNK